VLGLSPKFGALIGSIPLGVLGGVSTVLFGLIAITGARIWVENRVDFSRGVNLFVAAVALIVGAANYTVTFGNFTFEGITLGTFGAIILYQIFRLADPDAERPMPIRERPEPAIREYDVPGTSYQEPRRRRRPPQDQRSAPPPRYADDADLYDDLADLPPPRRRSAPGEPRPRQQRRPPADPGYRDRREAAGDSRPPRRRRRPPIDDL
jgi:hypothetical protein